MKTHAAIGARLRALQFWQDIIAAQQACERG